MHDGGSIPEGECIMMASYKLMHKAGKLVKLPWKDREADLYGYPEDDIGRYKWPSAIEAVTYFASLGYYIPDEVEHRALPDARREAAIAVAIKCEEIGSRPISNTEETVIRPPDVRNTMSSLTLGLAASQCTTFGRDRYDQLVKSTAEFIVSPFSAENPSDWAMDYVHAPEGGGLTDEAWLEKYGLDRMHLLEKTRLLLEGIERMYQELWVCPVCGTLEAGEGEPVTIAGGRIRNTAGGGEHGGFQRCGCDTCDYELNYETF
jgi:hypothetical protein